jgi:hypothetical protein
MLGRVIFTWCILAAIGSLVTGTLPPHIGMLANRTIPPELRSLHNWQRDIAAPARVTQKL